MNDLHPHWTSTGEDPIPVRSVPVANQPSKIQIAGATPRFGRRIAALTGCLLVFGLGIMLARQINSQTAQVIGAPVKSSSTSSLSKSVPVRIRITETGLVPATQAALPGQRVIWKNETDIPHILESEILIDQSGSLLYTPAIFPDMEEAFVISADMEPGQYPYESTTSSTIKGFLVIQEDPNASSSSSIPAGPNLAIKAATSGSSASSTARVSQEALLPTNPYTVEGGRDHPFDASGNPIDSAFDNDNSAPATRAHKPKSQPTTGPGLWIISLASIAGLTFAARKYLVRI